MFRPEKSWAVPGLLWLRGSAKDNVQFPNTPVSPHGTTHSGDDKSGNAQQAITQLMSEVIRLRDKMVDRRVVMQNERRHCSKQLDLALENQNKFEEICATSPSPEDSLGQNLQSKMLSILKDVRSSNGNLSIMLHNLNEEEAKLCKLENDLEHKEARLYRQLSQMQTDGVAPALSNDDGMFLDDYVVHSVKTQPSTPSIETIPTVREYYDRIGDIGLLQERLYNFEAEYQRQLRLREDSRQEGRNVEPPEAVFYQKHFNQRLLLIQAYSTAKADVGRLKSKCIDHGHEVDDPKMPPMVEVSDLDHSYRISRLEELVLSKNAEISAARSVASPTTLPTFLPRVEASYRIRKWLAGNSL